MVSLYSYPLPLPANNEFTVITALNLSNFAANGPLPADHIPNDRTFIASQLAPFATNIQFQRMPMIILKP